MNWDQGAWISFFLIMHVFGELDRDIAVHRPSHIVRGLAIGVLIVVASVCFARAKVQAFSRTEKKRQPMPQPARKPGMRVYRDSWAHAVNVNNHPCASSHFVATLLDLAAVAAGRAPRQKSVARPGEKQDNVLYAHSFEWEWTIPQMKKWFAKHTN